jgi:hypothetical protein
MPLTNDSNWKSDRTVGAGKLLKRPASSLCSQGKIKQSITCRTAPASAQAKFRSSIQREMLSASFRSTTRIEGFDAVIESQEAARDLRQTDAGCVGGTDFSPSRFRDRSPHKEENN